MKERSCKDCNFKKTDYVFCQYNDMDGIVPVDYCAITTQIIQRPFWREYCPDYKIGFIDKIRRLIWKDLGFPKS